MIKSFVIDGKKVNPRKGKYIAQGAHAALKSVIANAKGEIDLDDSESWPDVALLRVYMRKESALYNWLTNGLSTKVCCVVETEEQLLSVYEKAKAAKLLTSLITDKGLTEFNGVETITCCAIGPAWSEELVGITDKLELF